MTYQRQPYRYRSVWLSGGRHKLQEVTGEELIAIEKKIGALSGRRFPLSVSRMRRQERDGA